MTEERSDKVSSTGSPPDATESSQARQRKRRRWDEPAESLVSAGIAVPGVIPLYPGGSVAPPSASVSGALITNLQPKIQDELILAREIVINDAEALARYKLTKRQTQEEIQKCTGAVVITRGKYRPPNALADGEKPLYLHISAGAQLKDTAERILAVDRAAAMVEEMLRQGQSPQFSFPVFQTALSNGVMALSTCVYLGFEADPSENIAARIRGPNDQYINHIMNETGATVVLRGCGSGHPDHLNAEESHQPLHLFLSSKNSRSLENAQSLAENLLHTISLECGASRVASVKVYNAVPPPQQLLAGAQTSTAISMLSATASSTAVPGMTAVGPRGVITSAGGMMGLGVPQLNPASYPHHLANGGTSYSGYAGIYPRATPLQQVALALRQSPSSITSTVAPVTSEGSKASQTSTNAYTIATFNSDKDKQPSQRRKFQELPVDTKASTEQFQGSELTKRGEPLPKPKHSRAMPPPKEVVSTAPPGRAMPPPSMPPPPSRLIAPSPGGPLIPPLPLSQFIRRGILKQDSKNSVQDKTQLDTVPDTLIKLMEYGDEDDEEEEEPRQLLTSSIAARKPFWAA